MHRRTVLRRRSHPTPLAPVQLPALLPVGERSPLVVLRYGVQLCSSTRYTSKGSLLRCLLSLSTGGIGPTICSARVRQTHVRPVGASFLVAVFWRCLVSICCCCVLLLLPCCASVLHRCMLLLLSVLCLCWPFRWLVVVGPTRKSPVLVFFFFRRLYGGGT